MMPDAKRVIPYPGAKEMILADIDDSSLITTVLKTIYDELPTTKKRKN